MLESQATKKNHPPSSLDRGGGDKGKKKDKKTQLPSTLSKVKKGQGGEPRNTIFIKIIREVWHHEEPKGGGKGSLDHGASVGIEKVGTLFWRGTRPRRVEPGNTGEGEPQVLGLCFPRIEIGGKITKEVVLLVEGEGCLPDTCPPGK